jgi:hypothetical protein
VLARFFEGTSLQRVKAHQFNFMRMAFTEIPPGMDIVDTIEKVTMLFCFQLIQSCTFRCAVRASKKLSSRQGMSEGLCGVLLASTCGVRDSWLIGLPATV